MPAGIFVAYDGVNNPVMRFEYADARMPFAMTKDGMLYYLAYDQVGSLRVVADGSGNPVKRIDYDSFGNIITETNPTMKIPFGFAGGLYDKDTKPVRFGFRDYDPDTGRWTAKDPIGFAGGDTDLYGYCLGDPVNFADPLGMNPYKDYPKNGGPGDASDQTIIDAKDKLAKGGENAQEVREAAREILRKKIDALRKELKGACGKSRTKLLSQIRALEAYLKTGFRAPSSPLIIIIIDPNTGLPVGMPKLPGETEIY